MLKSQLVIFQNKVYLSPNMINFDGVDILVSVAQKK